MPVRQGRSRRRTCAALRFLGREKRKPRCGIFARRLSIVTLSLLVLLAGCVSVSPKHNIPGWPSVRKESFGCPDISGTYLTEGRSSDGGTDQLGTFLGASVQLLSKRDVFGVSGSPFRPAEKNQPTVVEIGHAPGDRSEVRFQFKDLDGNLAGEFSMNVECQNGGMIFSRSYGPTETALGLAAVVKGWGTALFPGEDGSLLGKRYQWEAGYILLLPYSGDYDARWSRWTRVNGATQGKRP